MFIKKQLALGISLACLVPQQARAIDIVKDAKEVAYMVASVALTALVIYGTTEVVKRLHHMYMRWSEARNMRKEISKVYFTDIAGAAVAKDELQDLVAYLKDPTSYVALGAQAPRGYLLYGPPGTGKTMLARAVAAEADCFFIAMSGTEFINNYIGTGPERMRELFRIARTYKRCIIFIDEIDTIGAERIQSPFHGQEYANTLNQLLIEMDGFSSSENSIVVIAATNRADVLDKALLRPGRFDKKIYVPLPTQMERFDILSIYAKQIVLDPSVDLMQVARSTTGFSGADLAELLRDAARIATKAKKTAVDITDIENARDTILVGQEQKTFIYTDAQKKRVAYHEAGHALVRVLLYSLDGVGVPLHKVTILPRGGALGITWFLRPEERQLFYTEDLNADIACALGGRIAEELIYNNVSTGPCSDLQHATNLAYAIVCELGMSPAVGAVVYTHYRPYSDKVGETIDLAIRTIIDTQYDRVRTLLNSNIDKLHAIAQALLEKETLTAHEVYELIGLQEAAII